jgi:hypothetical protein
VSTLEEKEARVAKVRKREEARLIKLAAKAGLFQWRLSSVQLEALLRDGLAAADTQRQSQLLKLENDVKLTKKRQSEQARREDAQRKILLGSFLIAQMEHKPTLKAQMATELEQFLNLHKEPNIAERNKDLLRKWLPTGTVASEQGEAEADD